MKKRIWELDVIRGIFLLCIIAYHLTYDLVSLFDLVDLKTPFSRFLYQMGNDWGGTPFLFISGICVSFAAHPIKRGLQVFGCGMLITAVTVAIWLLGFVDKSIIIYFGVLHCLGTCMLLWQLFKKVPAAVLIVIGVLLAGVGLYLKNNVWVDFPWLIPLGIPSYSFASSDYFPLLPNFGYFLVGSGLGKLLYPNRQTLFPKVNAENPVIRFFSFWGKNSLLIYLLHQPILAGLVGLWVLLFH